ncbi:MAG TPA: ATP-binding protein [Syntrophobacteraceae bacterium]|nr:ATP-binding protein [Syntrophobacteraceae bacterium]
MLKKETIRRTGFIAFLLISITFLHYFSPRIAHDRYHLEVVFQRLYFLPIVLGCLWFDLRGGLYTFCAVFLLIIPHHVYGWSGINPDGLIRVMQLVVYFAIAVVLGKTASRQKREQLKAKQAENLAAIGKSLSAVAHDMKTPLIAIGGFANLIRKHLPPGNPDRSKLDIIISETARLESMLKDMLDFSRPLDLNRVEVDIYSTINECLSIVGEDAGTQKVNVRASLAHDLPRVLVDPMRIRQALINILTNAVQASSEGDTVSVRCYCRGKNLSVDVIDCGCGIPLEIREEIFPPFFTTKKDGTGLGLPIVKKILEAHGGILEIIDNRSRGTTFKITIPTQ